MAMIRKQVYLTASLDRDIKAESKRRAVSEADVIRERLEGSPALGRRVRTPAELRLVDEALAALRALRAKTKEGPGTGRFNREELYAERLDRITPR